LGQKLAKDRSPDVRRGLANNLVIIAAKSRLSAGGFAATALSDDPY